MSKSLHLQVLLKAVDQATRPLKSIQQASKALAGDIKTTQQTLKTLDAQAARIDGFRKQQGQLAVTGQALKKAKAEAAALAVQFKATEKPTAQQARLLAASRRAAPSCKRNTMACASPYSASVTRSMRTALPPGT
jgi:phage-related tail protein